MRRRRCSSSVSWELLQLLFDKLVLSLETESSGHFIPKQSM